MATSAPSLSRTSSTASVSSTDDAAAGNSSAVIRRTRKRFTSDQLAMLESLFHQNSHPSREEREGVAKVGGMEVKSVTIWFQNKRQTERRVALLNSSDTLISTTSLATTTKPRVSAPTHSTASSRPSLDRIASRTELRTSVPRTPTRRCTPGVNLWDNMLSSPAISPISPPPLEYVELAKNQRVRRTLEWACAAARLAEKEGIIAASFSHPPPPRRTRARQHQAYRRHHIQARIQAQHRHRHPAKADADLTEEEGEESDELITPTGSWVQEEDRWIDRPDGAMQAAVVSLATSKCASQGARGEEDDVMRAALALCGLGRRS